MNVEKTNYTIDKVRELQRKLYLSSKNNDKRKFHALYDKIYRIDILEQAWRKVKENRGSSGIDNKSIEFIEINGVDKFLLEIQKELQEGKYIPKPVRRVNIPKSDGKTRPLGIPTIKDRVIQAATKTIIEPIFEPHFSGESYGFRPKKNAHQAIDSIRRACNNKGNWILDADIEGYFNNINHEKLMLLVQRRINDKRVLKLIRKWLKCGIIDGNTFKESEIGSPQGGVISPLLANIYLDTLDYIWNRNFKKFGKLVRYADDFVVICKTRKDVDMAYKGVCYIMQKLELKLSPSKTKIISLWQGKQSFDFLGYTNIKCRCKTKTGQVYYRIYQFISKKSIKKIRDKTKFVLSRKTLFDDLKSKIAELNLKIIGWRNYYNITPYHRLVQIDKYIIFRLVIWYNSKRKKSKRYKFRELAKLFRNMGVKYVCQY